MRQERGGAAYAGDEAGAFHARGVRGGDDKELRIAAQKTGKVFLQTVDVSNLGYADTRYSLFLGLKSCSRCRQVCSESWQCVCGKTIQKKRKDACPDSEATKKFHRDIGRYRAGDDGTLVSPP